MTAPSDHTPASPAQRGDQHVRSPRSNTGAVTRLPRCLATGTVVTAVLALAGAGATHTNWIFFEFDWSND